MPDPVSSKSGDAFTIITMKSDLNALSGKISKQENLGEPKIDQKPVLEKKESKDFFKDQIPTPVNPIKKQDQVFQATNFPKPKSVVDPDLLEISSHEAELDVPPPPPPKKPQYDHIDSDIDLAPMATKVLDIKKEQNIPSLPKDDFEIQIEKGDWHDSQKNNIDLSASKKIEQEKKSIESAFRSMPGEQKPELKKVIIGEPEPLPKPSSPNDDLKVYDKQEIINPQIVKEVKEELMDAITPDELEIPKKPEIIHPQTPIQAKPEIKPVEQIQKAQEIKPAPKPEIKLDPISQKLAEIEKQKEQIKEERKIIYADCKQELSDIEIQKEKHNKAKFELLGKTKDIRFNELEPLLAQEEKIQNDLALIKEKEKTASTLAQEEKIFQERSDKEKQRQSTEKKRWEIEDKIQALKNQIKSAEDSLKSLEEKERKINEKREKFNAKVEKIEFQEKACLLEKELLALKEGQEKISNEYADLIPQKDRLNELLRESLLSKTELEKQISELEAKELSAPKEEKRNFEKQRQEKEIKRQDVSKKSIDTRKEKESIEKRIFELSTIIKESTQKENEIKSRINTINKALQENYNNL